MAASRAPGTRNPNRASGTNAALPGNWTFAGGELELPDVQQLLALHLEQMRSSSPPEACHVLPVDGLKDPAIAFWTLRDGRRLLAVGALRHLDDRHGEVKSMRTAPDALGLGAGTAMLRHIVAEALGRGYRRLSLETGSTELFQPALRMYARHGFIPCGPFAGYKASPFTVFLTRTI